ncbi:hypothetical protein T05_14620 [Trichinella murrelli]|uniref:Uncharacterized protein n=1 Tax=Trichinella murrelli TaxID=144512 RepID=A0A0V0STJ4_9BILA|nr:hypothetical protein T05_14620 [Trichinella murrelli]
MRYREESGGQEHSDFSFCLLMLAISRFQSQLTDFPMYRLAEGEIMPVFRKVWGCASPDVYTLRLAPA